MEFQKEYSLSMWHWQKDTEADSGDERDKGV